MDSFIGLTYDPATGTRGFTFTVIDFESAEFVQQHFILAKTDPDPVDIGRVIGDYTLLIQTSSSTLQNGVAVVMFWAGDKAVSLNAIGLPQTQEVLDCVLVLADLASSHL